MNSRKALLKMVIGSGRLVLCPSRFAKIFSTRLEEAFLQELMQFLEVVCSDYPCDIGRVYSILKPRVVDASKPLQRSQARGEAQSLTRHFSSMNENEGQEVNMI